MEASGPARQAVAAADPALGAATASGLGPRVAACLAYSAWWVSGALVLAIEPAHPFVRFHARQAWVGFGTIWLAGVACWAASFATAFVSPVVFRATAVLANLIWAAGVACWLACLVSAARGRRWVMPGLSRLAARHG